MKACIIVGTRPQIIKSQPLIKEILSRKIKLSIIHTGQHYDYQLSRSFFKELKIKSPDLNLGIKPTSTANQLSQIISKLESPLKKIEPDLVIIPGDTRSALGAALCANRLGIKIAHVEAGARSMEFSMEEETNRRMIDHISQLLFAPTQNCLKNLKNEHVLGTSFFTGDTMYDVFLEFKKLLKLKKLINNNDILMTLHRKENIEDFEKIKRIINLAKKLTQLGYKIIFPIHPHTKKQLKIFGISLNGINTISPVKYSDMLRLLSEVSLLITDSGGLQKEAFWVGTACITLRNSTEWTETLVSNHNVLMKNVTKNSLTQIQNILKKPQKFKQTSLFGDGNASKKITSILLKQF
jgi:UDP-GlcNAc3NAcA epimerase